MAERDVCRGDGVQIFDGQAAPGRAQNGQPGDAIGQMQQGERQRHQILNDGALAELIDFDGLKGNVAAAQQRRPRR